jgi:hypothetical protein
MEGDEMISIIHKFFKKTPPPEEEEERCQHDWATVTTYDPKELLGQMRRGSYPPECQQRGVGPCNIRKVKRYTMGDGMGYNTIRSSHTFPTFVWQYDFDLGYGVMMKSHSFYVSTHDVSDRVCLLCGQCHEGKQLFVKKVMDQMKDKLRQDQEMCARTELAKKMWKDGGCR